MTGSLQLKPYVIKIYANPLYLSYLSDNWQISVLFVA